MYTILGITEKKKKRRRKMGKFPCYLICLAIFQEVEDSDGEVGLPQISEREKEMEKK